MAFLPGNTNNDFTSAVEQWFANYFEPTALHDQKQYFLQATKAFAMSVKETATRVEEIIRYMRYMPGAPAAGTPIYSPVEKKMTLYRLMRPRWRTAFDASGNDITSAECTWANLISYFSSQERSENRSLVARGVVPAGRFRSGRGRFGAGRGGYGRVRRSGYQGGGLAKRFRSQYGAPYAVPGHYGYTQGYGRGYGGGYRQSYPTYQAGGQMYPRGGAGRFGGRGAGGAGRGGRGGHMVAGRGAGGRGRGVNHPPPGLTRGGYPRRAAGAYLADGGSEMHQIDSFESGGSTEVNDAEAAAMETEPEIPPEDPYDDAMYYGEETEQFNTETTDGAVEFDDFGDY